jgi:hypothetical protein
MWNLCASLCVCSTPLEDAATYALDVIMRTEKSAARIIPLSIFDISEKNPKMKKIMETCLLNEYKNMNCFQNMLNFLENSTIFLEK